MKTKSKLAHSGTLRLCTFALLMGALSGQTQTPSPGGGITPVPAASAVTPARPPTGPASTAIAPRWGDGVLEREFLVKLRKFLETDPFDFKGFEVAFGVRLEANPPDRPYPDGGWSIGNVRYGYPFGQTFNNRTRGGAYWAFDPGRNSAYLSMEFVKVAFGDHEKLHLPCLTMDQFMDVFEAPGWTNGYLILRYADGLPVYGPRQFQTKAANGVAVRFIPQGGGGCSPYLSVNFDRLRPHPASKQ